MSNLVLLTKVGSSDSIESVVAFDGLRGGNLVVLGARNANGTFPITAPVAVTDQKMVLVAPVCLPYSDTQMEHDYQIEAGNVERAYVPVKGRVYGVPVINITATDPVAVGNFVVPQAGNAEMESLQAANLAGNETVQFEIIQLFAKAGVNYASLLCVKSE